MKTIAASIAGLLLSIMTFVAGFFSSSIYFDADKMQYQAEGLDSSALWTSEPVTVDRSHQSFERLPARPVPEARQTTENMAATGKMPKDADQASATARADDSLKLVDPVTTGAVDPRQSEAKSSPREEQAMAHIEWCSRHYRSYRAADNSYQPYGGGRRLCNSPYSSIAAAGSEPISASNGTPTEAQRSRDDVEADENQTEPEQVAFDESANAYASEGHAQSCLQRYRSYRLEDNSYQPFDGGPRRQCR